MTETRADIGIIGGSGFYNFPDLDIEYYIDQQTAFGSPSSRFAIGKIGDAKVAFLARHGTDHTIHPHLVNDRANIIAMKALGVKKIFAVSAVGSLQPHIRPGHLVLPSQYLDRTQARNKSLFEDTRIVVHVSMADPFCLKLQQMIALVSQRHAVTHHQKNLVVIEGPSFSTRFEHDMYHKQGLDIIGMTTLPEARLAREAEICYVPLCFATDTIFGEDVSAQAVLETHRGNVEAAQKIIHEVITTNDLSHECACNNALQDAFATDLKHAGVKFYTTFGDLLDKYREDNDEG